MRLEKMVELFVSEMKRKNRSEDTIKSYTYDLNGFSGWFNSQGYKCINELKIIDLNHYIESLEGCKASTLNRKIASLKSLYKFLYNNEIVSENVAAKLENATVPKTKPVIMADDSVRKVLDACESVWHEGKNEQRDFVMIKLLYNSGVRRQELINLEISDFNVNENRLLIRGKGNKERYIDINKEVSMLLVEFISDIRPLFLNAMTSDKIFISQQSSSLCRTTVNNIVNRYFDMAGVNEKGVGAHSTRKKFLTKAYNNTGDIFAVSKLAGHSNVNTIRHYVEPDRDRLKNVSTSVCF